MARTFILSFMALICCFAATAQPGKTDYTAQWKKIDGLRGKKNLSQSALEEIQKVYRAALDEKEYGQAIKSIIYRVNCQGQMQENTAASILDSLKQDAARLPQPAKSIVYSLMADVYKLYYRQNAWQILLRTRTAVAGDDINTWDISRLFEEAMKYYLLSIQDEKILQKTSVDEYNEILYYACDREKQTPLLPTLYDFLVFRTVQSYNSEMSVALPQQTFVLNRPEYLADVQTFVNIPVENRDTLSAEYMVITLYQKALGFRLQQAQHNPSADNRYALVNLDIERLKYVHLKGKYADNDLMYENALKTMMSKYAGQPEWGYVAYELASLYKKQGADWRNLKNDRLRPKYKEADALCDKIIANDADGRIATYADELKDEIRSLSVQLTVEHLQYPGTPIRALVKYRNAGKLYLYLYRLTDDEAYDVYDVHNFSLDDFEFDGKKPFRVQEVTVPSQSDFHGYSTEIKIDALPQGFYALFASEMPDLPEKGDENPDEKMITGVMFQVSPLNMVLRSGDNQLFGKSLDTKQNITQVYLADGKTGEPLKQAKIDICTVQYQPVKTGAKPNYVEVHEGSYHTDAEGLAYIPDKDRDFKKIIITGKNGRLVLFSWNSGYWWREQSQTGSRAALFTDRSIYRPGQTVYYKALYFKSDFDGKNRLIPNSPLTVSFTDVNGKTIGTQTSTTNEFGTIQGQFVIPQGLLNGRMTLVTTGGSVDIQVEEYKRPTFEVKFDPVDKNYSLNDPVCVSGMAKALAGYPVDNSKVQYRVVRNAHYRTYRRWFPGPAQPQRAIASGELTTDSKGAFTIEFKAEAEDIKNDDLIYGYTVTADVTDANGETRSAALSVKISKKPLLIAASIPESIVDRTSLSFDLTTTNLNGDFTPADVSVTVTALRSPARILRSRLWAAPDTFALPRAEFEKYFPYDAYGDEDNPANYALAEQVAGIRLNTGKDRKINLGKLEASRAGWYRLDISARSENGVEITEQKFVQLLGDLVINTSKLPMMEPTPIERMADWLTVIKASGEPGENAEFWVAGGEKKSYIRYEVLFKNRMVEQKAVVTGITPTRVVIPVREEYRGGFAVQFVMIQNQRVYRYLANVDVPYTNKKLDVAFTTFRDKLLPGEQEKWTLTVKNKQGEKEMAEMAATLYDASLDAFRPHSWNGCDNFYPGRGYYHFQWQTPEYQATRTSQYNDYDEYQASIFAPQYPYLNMFGMIYLQALNDQRNSSVMIRGMAAGLVNTEAKLDEVVVAGYSMLKKDMTGSATVLKDASSASLYGSRVGNALVIRDEDAGNGTPQPSLTETATRQNFNETAFFYPQLRTDENGEIIIEFTVPEALTRWKMLGFAHTRDFKVGNITNELVTQKQVAISANAPRFFRESDIIELTAKVNNLTGNDLTGRAMLRLFDATNMQPVDAQIVRSPQTQDFSVKAGESTGLKWTLSIPAGIQAITYKVTAQAGSHTDGEEKTVPVLTNSMLVTETMPFSVRAGVRKEFTFKRMKENQSSTLRNHRLTLEFTSNPAWYAVQAMPCMMEYPYECAEQTFTRFYANSLAATIANSSPRIRQVFDLWRTLPEYKDALLSNLEKNRELKQVMLEETPWVMQAASETERKKRVGLLFDLNRMGSEQQRAFDKLQKMQLGNGGFPWFDGLPASRFITQHIVAGVAHLQKLHALNKDFTAQAGDITQRGLAYLDGCIREDYDALLKIKNVDLGRQHITPAQLHYLYACSFSKHQPQNEAQRKALDYYRGQAARYWMNFNLYSQAMTALALNRYGDRETAAGIVRSLKERALHSEEMGMYWKDNTAGYFWYQAPVETQAMLIEAFNEIANDKASVEEMKIWLLRNKQTNDWRTTKATAEACYALLMTGGNLLDESRTLDVKIGGKPLASVAREEIRPEPGTGYVKTAWNGSDIQKDMAVLEVDNPNKSGIAWGGMYWQYFEQLDKITGAETSLRMNKQLFLKRITGRGAELLPLNEQNTLKTGDVVTVRMELRADRDYEYVHLKDMRAAGFEPVKNISGYRYQDGLWYYESIKDASTNFFISCLRKGVYVFEYELRVTHAGQFSNGITTFQCMYAPEFSAHSEGVRVKVE